MKKLVWVLCFITAVTGVLLGIGRNILLEKTAEWFLNRSLSENLAAPIDIQNLSLGFTTHFEIGRVHASIQTHGGSLPLEIGRIRLKHCLFHILTKRLPFTFMFDGLKPFGSNSKGIRGEITFAWFQNQGITFQAKILELHLNELTVLDTQNLKGVTGTLNGDFVYRIDEKQNQFLDLQLNAPEPGGALQAQLFSLLVPYLPKSAYRTAVEQIQKTGLVHYNTASISLHQEAPSRMKILVKILVPDYNLDLNVNAEIRVDNENTLLQIAQVLGMIRST